MKELAQSFNNRELALLIWVTLLIGAISFNGMCRKSLSAIIKDLCKPIFWVPLLLAASYNAGIVYFFSTIGWWSLANLKSTILWLMTFAFVSMFETGLSENYKTTLRKISLDIFKITSLFIFITELHTFHLVVEVILLPIITLLALMAELAKNKPEHVSVAKLVNAALTLFILGFFMFSLWMIYDNFEETKSSVRFSEILIPVALSIFFIPFLFLWCLYVAYNGAFSVITHCLKDKKLISYAYWLAVTQIRDNTDLLQQWKSEIVATHPSTKTMLRNSLTSLRKLNEHELSPPIISPDKGWSPYLAKDFMKG